MKGLDASAALYEWNYPKQLLHIKIEEGDKEGQGGNRAGHLRSGVPDQATPASGHFEHQRQAAGTLIDEVDRSDEEFEAFLLEVLSDFQITIPEIGTLRAKERPMVVVTSNRTRDVHDALKRRCLYHWIDYPSIEKEYAIVKTRLPGIEEGLAKQVSHFMRKIRDLDFPQETGHLRDPGLGGALIAMERKRLDEEIVMETLGCILKYQDDIKRFPEEVWSDLQMRQGIFQHE
jgi:MoxR-like ATPase